MVERRRVVVLLAVVGAVGTAMLLRFPPDAYSFYPECPVHEYLGRLCPGCGGTRALAALLRGHVAEALRLNALCVALLPVFAVYAGVMCRRAWTAPTFRWPAVPAVAPYCGWAAVAVFTLIRNC